MALPIKLFKKCEAKCFYLKKRRQLNYNIRNYNVILSGKWLIIHITKADKQESMIIQSKLSSAGAVDVVRESII